MAPKLLPIGRILRNEIKRLRIRADGSKTGANYIRSIGVGRPRKKSK